ELLCSVYHQLHGFDVTCLRFFAVYGPRQRPDMALYKFAGLVRGGREVPLYDHGKAVRDFSFVTDVVKGVLAAVERCGGLRVYNLGHSRPYSMGEVVEELERAFGAKARTKFMPAQPGDLRVLYASIDRAARELDYRPEVDLPEGMRRFVEWYLNQEAQTALAGRLP
ncbi:MAG: NAD-dependent epimerase/dehydratase family protein, partial [Deltaproteobacteria bacterium]|nr:NAD-dependent epimerase/dehydratase family protein [Deltaproteobacteria bacterium]